MGDAQMGRTGGRVARLAHKTEPWGFPVVYLGWAFLWWTPIVASSESVWSFPNLGFFLLGGLSPLVAGLGLAWLREGRAGLADLGRRLIDVGRIDPIWWVVILVFWPLFNLVLAGTAQLLERTDAPLELISTAQLFDPVAIVSLVAFAFVFPLVEEVGVRGYWLDGLQERWGAFVGGLVNGATWAAWHVPLVFFPGYYANTTFDPDLSWWLPSIVLTALVLVWVYNNTRRSILAVVLFHGFGNLTGETMGFAPAMYPFVLAGYVLVVVILLLGWSPHSLRGWNVSVPRPAAKEDTP